jgi:DNA helicase IV
MVTSPYKQKFIEQEVKQFITYSLLYLVDITHNINFDHYTVYLYATHNVKNVIWHV